MLLRILVSHPAPHLFVGIGRRQRMVGTVDRYTTEIRFHEMTLDSALLTHERNIYGLSSVHNIPPNTPKPPIDTPVETFGGDGSDEIFPTILRTRNEAIATSPIVEERIRTGR